MEPLTQDYLDERLDRLDARLSSLIDATHAGFAENEKRFQMMETTLATLVESVDRFAKIYTDLNQELVVMRQHLRDMEVRMDKMELKLNAA